MLSIGIWPPSLGNAAAAAVSAVDDDVTAAAVDDDVTVADVDGNATNAAAAAVDDAAVEVEMKYRWRDFFIVPLPLPRQTNFRFTACC